MGPHQIIVFDAKCLIYYKHMCRCLAAHSSESQYSTAFYFLIVCTILIYLSYTIILNFLIHILSIFIMYQVLQVYTSLSFSLIISFEVYKRSSVVAETSPPSRGDVAVKLRRRRRKVAETTSQLSPQSFGLEQVSETSLRRLPRRKHI